jgi:hypothetical protein
VLVVVMGSQILLVKMEGLAAAVVSRTQVLMLLVQHHHRVKEITEALVFLGLPKLLVVEVALEPQAELVLRTRLEALEV